MNELKKIYIVIEETGKEGGKGFDMYLAGDTQRLGRVDPSEMTPAEFYGEKLFNICIGILKDVGAVKSVHKRENH